MTLWTTIGRQLRHPSGPVGWMVGRLMPLLNARPNALAIAALEIDAADEILELGCGPGHGVRRMAALAPRGRVHALDPSSPMLAQARARDRHAIGSGRV